MPATQTTPRILISRFPGTCTACHGRFDKGEPIIWHERGKATHEVCPSSKPAVLPIPPKPAVTASPTASKPATATDNGDALAKLAEAIALLSTSTLDRETVAEMITQAIQAREPKSVRVIIENRKSGETAETMPTDHSNMAQLLYLLAKRHHVYLYGEPGSGKSTAAQLAAQRMGLQYGYVALNPQSPKSELFGFIRPDGTFQETVFYQCYKNGGIFCIDEMDNSSGALLTTLNGALENGHCAFPCGIVDRHADFIVVATGNTCGRGASPQFPERRPFDAAFGERFFFIEWSYDTELEKNITLTVNPKADTWLEWVSNVRAFCQTNYPKLLASPRASFRGADYLGDTALEPAQIADGLVFKGIDRLTKQAILRAYPLPERVA